jgi:cytoskeletal protein CcmA (bactofilin family)
LGDRSGDVEADFGADVGERAEMGGKCDADHGVTGIG